MSFTVPEIKSSGEGAALKVLTEGRYDAVLVGLVELGFHETFHQGKSTGVSNKVLAVFEVPGQETEAGKPLLISKEMTLNFHPKAKLYAVTRTLTGIKDEKELRKIMTTSPSDFLGKAAVIHIENFESSYTKGMHHMIDSFSELDPRVETPVAKTEPFIFTFGEDADVDVFSERLTKFSRSKIMSAGNAKTGLPKSIFEAHRALVAEEESKSNSGLDSEIG